ncbi:hypothetical protein [Methylobacterium brachythecii]|uniref:DUF3320 domain-containing protein n=1 Tax=Methylobacterium brachythecii TaxID=1176177 RepID=A0A7W6AQX4_9HYPH|nr:hypothetical protein [Methylobacterium brachythecii]MBB3905610.1 hypothetical protein [Methylobacterium brachythecii]GLS46963.1 hypothetical protein GCM10007884_49630 [Methylobacterium brachythecii]
MSDPTPRPIPPGDFEAQAKALAKERDLAKKALLNGFAQIFKARDGIEKAHSCPATLAGIAADMVVTMEDADYLALMRERGLAILAGIPLPEREVRIQPLQVISTGEPDATVRDLLSNAGFRRHAGTDATLEIYVGEGSLTAWRKLQSHRITVSAITLPGGLSLDSIAHGGGQDGPTPQSGAAPTDPVPASGDRDGAGEPTSETLSETGRSNVGTGKPLATPRFRPYRMATVSAPEDQDWALHRAKPAQYAALMDGVITQEGPVTCDNAIEALRLGLGLSAIHENSRTKLKAAVAGLVADGGVLALGGDVYHKADLPILPRDRTGCPARIRTLAALPEAEITAALLEVLDLGEPGDDDAVLISAALRLGYGLKSPGTNRALSERIRAAITGLVERPGVTRDGQGRLVRAPNPPGTTARDDHPAIDAPPEGASPDQQGDVISFPVLSKGFG